MLAVKLFSDTSPEANSAALQLAETTAYGCGIEIGLYTDDFLPADLEARIARLPRQTKALHSRFRQIGLEEIALAGRDALDRLESERLACLRMGISASVVHGFRNPDDAVRTDYPEPRETARRWADAAMRMSEMGMRPLYEKTFESMPWLEVFFAEWDQLGIAAKAGFCLDIGHSRVWHRASLETWLEFTRWLRDRGFAVHFHIHGNGGDWDWHVPLHLAAEKGFLDPSVDWAPRGVLPWLRDAVRQHPESLFVLENKTEFAGPALRFATEAIGGVGGGPSAVDAPGAPSGRGPL